MVHGARFPEPFNKGWLIAKGFFCPFARGGPAGRIVNSEIMKRDEDGAVPPVAERGPNRWNGLEVPPVPHGVDREIPLPCPSSPALTGKARDAQARENPEATKSPRMPVAQPGQLLSDLAEIRAVDFCCSECQTVVSLPRIRWVNSPENCPNCGARWMRKPSPDNLSPEDDSAYVYRVVSSFREALQRLISVKQSVAFHLLLEIDETPNHR